MTFNGLQNKHYSLNILLYVFVPCIHSRGCTVYIGEGGHAHGNRETNYIALCYCRCDLKGLHNKHHTLCHNISWDIHLIKEPTAYGHIHVYKPRVCIMYKCNMSTYISSSYTVTYGVTIPHTALYGQMT